MPLLARALFTASALALGIAPGIAKEILALKPLIGSFGKGAEACRSYHRSGGVDRTRFSKYESKYYYDECAAKACQAEILSHRRSGGDHVMTVRWFGSDGSSTDTIIVKHISKDKILVSGPGGDGETFTRCTERDAIAGIGLPAPNQAIDVDFSAYYALAVSRLCPSLQPGTELASLDSPPAYRTREVKETAAWYAELDKKEIKNFCREALSAFGPGGRVAPNLLLPKN